MTVTEAEIAEHRALLQEILRMANGDLLALYQLVQMQDPDVQADWLLDGVPEIVAAYRAAAVDVGAVFYAETQGLKLERDMAAAAAAVNTGVLEQSLRWAIFAADPAGIIGRLAGVVQRHVVDGSRETGMLTAAATKQAWVRAAHPGACQFCRLLATRGLDGVGGFTSKETATFAGMSARGVRKAKKGHSRQDKGDKFHDNCMCVPVLAEAYTPPDYVLEWERDYFAALDELGTATDQYAVLAQMRKTSGHNH